MNVSTRTPIALALMLVLASTACSEAANEARQTAGDATQAAADATADATAEGGLIAGAFAEARDDLRTKNFPIGPVDGLPRAELTPQGDLLIDGVAVPMTPEQREAALAFRTEIVSVADAGIVMGAKGAAIAGDALALAATGVFGGDTKDAEARIEARGKAMEAEAVAICARVAQLDVAGDRLAAVLPQFKPYADKIDIKADCNVAETTDDAEQQAEDAATESTVST